MGNIKDGLGWNPELLKYPTPIPRSRKQIRFFSAWHCSFTLLPRVPQRESRLPWTALLQSRSQELSYEVGPQSRATVAQGRRAEESYQADTVSKVMRTTEGCLEGEGLSLPGFCLRVWLLRAPPHNLASLSWRTQNGLQLPMCVCLFFSSPFQLWQPYSSFAKNRRDHPWT